MSESALRRALRDPATLHHLATTALSAAATPDERAGALALLELAGEDGTAPAPPAVATPAAGSAAITHMAQLLSAEERAALARFDHAQRAAGEAAEAERERAWQDWESAHLAAGSRPQEAALGAAPPDDYWAWLRPEGPDLADVHEGYGDNSTTVAPTR